MTKGQIMNPDRNGRCAGIDYILSLKKLPTWIAVELLEHFVTDNF